MPALALLLKVALGNMYALYLAITSQALALRLGAIAVMAAAYVACVVGFTTFIAPLIGALFATSYGQVIGLAFPPISGTVVFGIVTLWGCLVAKAYYMKVIKLGLH